MLAFLCIYFGFLSDEPQLDVPHPPPFEEGQPLHPRFLKSL
ncbi:hypothetical protein BMY_2007 [Wohlfahrtiimonas chitiniclastica]|nr:hypothetical protein [Wohlfahrtiimonas chitiniclastica]KZS24124.1 hypothetical protein BMY_2007 [Wohlfahrtiimonas chitiniclastica]